MDLQTQAEHYRLLLDNAQVGWWEAYFGEGYFVCSDFIIRLFGMDNEILTFLDFRLMIREDYRDRITFEFASVKNVEVYEQIFPVYTCFGVKWVRSKLCRRSVDENGNTVALGVLQLVQNYDALSGTEESQLNIESRINLLLSQLGTLSRTFYSFAQSKDLDYSIHKIFAEILSSFGVNGRMYIFEYDNLKRTMSCIYETCSEGVCPTKPISRNIPLDTIPWTTEKLINAHPVIINTMDELPSVASSDKDLLLSHGAFSTILIPMIRNEKVFGVMGMDIVDSPRIWSNEDYQWLSSIANVISICMELVISEKKAQTERRDLENLYSHMPLGYVRKKLIYDKEGNPVDYRIIDANKAAEHISGYLNSDCIGHTASEQGLVLSEPLDIIIKTLENNGYHEKNTFFPITQKTCYNITYSTQKGELISLFSDITEMVKAHEALDRSEKLFRNLFAHIPVGVELYDKNGYLVDLNKTDMKIFGIARKKDVLGINIFRNPIMPVDVIKNMKERKPVVFRLNYPFKKVDNYYATVKEGSIDISTKASMLYDSKGELINYVLINLDNTEKTVAYNRIEEFEKFFELVSEFGKVGYAKFYLKKSGGYASNQWYQNLGEKVGRPLDEIVAHYEHIHPDDREAMILFFDKVKMGQADSIRKELRVVTTEGWKWTRVNVMRNTQNRDPEVLEMICINYDITEQKESQIQRDKAQELDRLKSAFIANMSHEIRTPLNAIVGFSTLLAETEALEEREQYSEIIQKNNDILLQLISDILDLSKIEAGSVEFNFSEIDLKELFREIIRSFSIKIPSGVKLFSNPELPAYTLYSDRTRLTQVISNFINNAIKYTEQGSIVLDYELHSEEIRFTVADTGEGMLPEVRERIFDRFYKGDTFKQGTGLGLSICEMIVHKLGGDIGVVSEVEKGSTFWFTIPLKPKND